MKKILATLSIGTLMVLAAPGIANAKGPGVTAKGKCSASSTSQIKLKADNGRIETEFEVDQNRVGAEVERRDHRQRRGRCPHHGHDDRAERFVHRASPHPEPGRYRQGDRLREERGDRRDLRGHRLPVTRYPSPPRDGRVGVLRGSHPSPRRYPREPAEKWKNMV